MFSLGGTELLLIGVVALLLFGPDKVPQMARALGRFMREFNKYKDIMESTLRTEMYATEAKATKDEPKRSDADKMGQAAQASRDFAAEHGAEVPEADDVLAAAALGTAGESSGASDEIGLTAPPVPAPPAAGPASAIATDEDEEEED
ncbi:MAG TPA: twin-arginine translocase TatA/TatE family subunit [Coriobacteriia bacterium]